MTRRHAAPTPLRARDLMKETRVLIPAGMSVREAAALLAAAGDDAAPVVDSDGRCVGLFSAADYRRWATRPGGRADVVSEWQIVPPAAPDEVRYHMTRRYAVPTPGAETAELLHRLDQAPDPFLIVLDRQRRPQGLVSAIDLLYAQSSARRGPRASVGFN